MSNLFVGIDLGIERKKTSAICILKEKNGKIFPLEEWCQNCQDIFGREVLKRLKPYLKDTKAIAIDSPLTKGKGKGKMRLFEKFFSRKIFREEKINPVPPALIPKVCDLSLKLRKNLEKEGFVLDINLIETSSRLVGSFLNHSNVLKNIRIFCKTKNQKSALFAALVAYFHSKFQTRYIGYKDGFLFLPKISLWKKEWRKKFYLAWKERPRLKYRYLITNIFEK
jgi:predicted nuclease with RNAse H fold